MQVNRSDSWHGKAGMDEHSSFLKRYGLATVMTLGAMLLSWVCLLIIHRPMIVVFTSLAIVLSAGFGGVGPGLLATALCGVLSDYLFVEPRGSMAIATPQGLEQLVTILVIGGLLSLILYWLRCTQGQAQVQETKFRSLFDRASIGKTLVDPDTGRFLLVNHRFCEIIGYSEQELAGMTFQHITYPEDREASQSAFDRLIRGEINEYKMEKRYVRGGDGRLIWGEILVTLMRTKAGRPLYVVGSIIDITQRKQAEDALRESEARYRQVVHSAGSVIIGMDISGHITMYNGHAEQLFGYTAHEVLGQHVVGTIVPDRGDDGREMRAYIANVIHDVDHHLYHENENITKDGRRLWMGWTNRPILEPDGTLNEIISVGLDLTDRKHTEEALRQSEERFRATFEHAPLGIEQLSLDGRLLKVNDALCRMLGYTRDELLGMSQAELTHPDDREPDERQLKRLLAGEIANYQIEKRYLRKDDGLVWVRVTSALTRPPHAYRISIAEDITTRKEAAVLQQERSFLRQVIDAAPNLIYVKDAQGRFILANKALAQWYGTSVEGIVGRADTDFNIKNEERERFRRDNWEVIAEHREKVIPEEMVTRTNGEEHWVSTIKVPLLNPDGSCDKVLGVSSDITERKWAEEAMRHSEEQYRTLMETIPQMIWTLDPSGRHTYCNHHWYEYTGLRIEDTLDEGWVRLLMHPDDVQMTQDTWRLTIEAGQSLESEVRLRRASDGAYRWHHTRIIPIRDAEQRIVKWVVSSVDIHELHIALDSLHEANERLATADRQKDEFLAMLAHELRNPLAPIRNAVHILNAFCTDHCENSERMQRQRRIIDRQVAHMARLLDDLLDVSRVTRGRIDLRKRVLRLTDVLAHAVETSTPLIESRHHELHVTYPPDILCIEGDIDRLAQVVGNLLANAAKYTDEGGQIWLEGECSTNGATIRVRDNGMGINPEMLPHVFDLFAQADQSLGRSRGGLGIGLTMVQKLVQLHGGAVEAHSEGLGKGSEFIVHLPASAVVSGTHTPPNQASGGATQVDSRPRRILIVDDVVDTTDSLAELLRSWGHEVKTAYSGVGALEIAPSFHPEVVLLDIGMPGLDGYEVAQRLRQMPEMAGAQLVALTGYGQEQDREAALRAGFDTLFVKPVDLNVLRDNVVGSIR